MEAGSFGARTSATLFPQSRFLLPKPHHRSPQNLNPFLLRPSYPRRPLHASTPPRSVSSLCCCSSTSARQSHAAESTDLRSDAPVNLEFEPQNRWNVEVGYPNVPSSCVPPPKLSLSDQAFFLLAFIACATTAAFTSLVIVAVPTLIAMGRAATSFAKLADTARLELPSTMAAMRLSSMEISDLTLELSDLSHEVADGVHKSAQAVQAAEAGIRQIGARACQQTASMIQERANLPVISLQPVVAGAAKKTSRAVGRATKNFMNIISRRSLENHDDSVINGVEI